mmetsp:Transcript_46975/g.117120  ORF Transcript_46975/g.117120 Transcript_46975/m.117120 type:complete len:238 (-) Transcript_46975:61-774(-)
MSSCGARVDFPQDGRHARLEGDVGNVRVAIIGVGVRPRAGEPPFPPPGPAVPPTNATITITITIQPPPSQAKPLHKHRALTVEASGDLSVCLSVYVCVGERVAEWRGDGALARRENRQAGNKGKRILIYNTYRHAIRGRRDGRTKWGMHHAPWQLAPERTHACTARRTPHPQTDRQTDMERHFTHMDGLPEQQGVIDTLSVAGSEYIQPSVHPFTHHGHRLAEVYTQVYRSMDIYTP